MMKPCACKCRCSRDRVPDCNDLCERCWLAWCEASEKHQPVADRSYLGTYGVTGLWTWWIANHASHMLAEPAAHFLREPERIPICPASGLAPHSMVRRPGAWKCYQHDPWVVQPIPEKLTRAPAVTVPLKETA